MIRAWDENAELVDSVPVTSGTWLMQISREKATTIRFSVGRSQMSQQYSLKPAGLDEVPLDVDRD